MAKVPRISQGALPSAVPQVAPEDTTDQIFGLLARGAGTAAHIALGMEAAEAKRLKEAADARRKLSNAIKVGSILRDFEDWDRGESERFQTEFQDAPDKAIEPYRKALESRMEATVRGVDDDDMALALTNAYNTKLESKIGRMFKWSVARQTTIDEMAVDEQATGIVTAAEGLSSAAEIEGHVNSSLDDIAPGFVARYGAEAEAKYKDLFLKATLAYAEKAAEDRPFQLANELESKKGPLADLSTAERATIRRNAKAGAEKLERNREFDTLRTAVGDAQDHVKAYVKGELSAGDIRGLITANEAKQRAVRNEDTTSPEHRDRQLKMLKAEQEVLERLRTAHRRQTPGSVVDEEGVVSALYRKQDELLTKKGRMAKDATVQDLLRQQRDVATAAADGKITPDKARTLLRDLDDAVTRVRESETKDSWYSGFPFIGGYGPRNAGMAVLDSNFARAASMTDKLKNLIRDDYLRELYSRVDDGAPVTAEDAEDIANRAYRMATGQPVSGGRVRR